MAMMLIGNHNILISNPRDLPAMVKELSKWKFSGFVGLNTLFVALCNNEGFRKLDFSALKSPCPAAWRCNWRGRALEGRDRLRHLRRLRHDRNQPGGDGQPDPEHPDRHHRHSGASTLCKVIDDAGRNCRWAKSASCASRARR
jgi:hypothetical protein